MGAIVRRAPASRSSREAGTRTCVRAAMTSEIAGDDEISEFAQAIPSLTGRQRGEMALRLGDVLARGAE
ncbi:MAG: hypothetical protein H0X45_07150, partial [Planctomycetes bacterium]|nr:hypothetical protein [Planctomycetota bacterium]